ncbi:integrase core domain-containing protein [Leptospira santarosai]|uniref:Integrase core domain protein n=1 Tax=Leptospira santarosai str. ZUN179 TaxID=1049985 RepID=M6UXW6_9LEPT|nr:integrase core domain protein [Leptospira santarosai str. HAI821]EMO45869.1 integrase core domain protein [Leptospira santarosai str. ZUN179]EMP01337.1 integrase core domain protein [Leptospira santarosai str. HAI1380]
MEDIDHSKTKIRRPQSNGICERFHRTVQDEFYALLSGRRHTNSIEDV